MAIGYGPGSNMVRTVDKQRSARKKRSLKESSDGTPLSNGQKSGALKYKKASPEQLAEIKAKMQKENKKNRAIMAVLLGLVLIAVIYVLMQPVY